MIDYSDNSDCSDIVSLEPSEPSEPSGASAVVIVFLVPAFLLLPHALGKPGIWLALAASEHLTKVAIIVYYLARK